MLFSAFRVKVVDRNQSAATDRIVLISSLPSKCQKLVSNEAETPKIASQTSCGGNRSGYQGRALIQEEPSWCLTKAFRKATRTFQDAIEDASYQFQASKNRL